MTAIVLGYRRHPLYERAPALRVALGEQPAGDGQLRRAPDRLPHQSTRLTSTSAYVAVPIMHFISSEMVDLIDAIRLLTAITTVRYSAFKATLNIETAIYMTVKVCRAVKPGAGPKEDTTHKPFRAVVAIGSAGIRGIVIVPVRASGFGSDVDTDLSLYFGSGHREVNSSNSGRENETFKAIHDSSSKSSGPRQIRLIEDQLGSADRAVDLLCCSIAAFACFSAPSAAALTQEASSMSDRSTGSAECTCSQASFAASVTRLTSSVSPDVVVRSRSA